MQIGINLSIDRPRVPAAGGPPGPGPGDGVDDILLETGDHMLLETGDAILLE